MKIELTPEERSLALGILEDRLGTLREQIYHSTTTEFTAMLKQKKHVLESVIAKLVLEPTMETKSATP